MILDVDLVEVLPPVLVTGLGRDAIFTCSSTSAVIVDVDWLINGTSFNSLQLNDVDQGFEPISGLGVLRFSSVTLEYNNTLIQCIANTTSHGVVSSRNSTLLIPGI